MMINETAKIDATLANLVDIGTEAWPIKPVHPPAANGKWYVVQINSGSERMISGFLMRLNFGVYYPLLRTFKPVPRKLLSAKQRRIGTVVKKPKLEPFLPGYLFTHFDMENDRWHDVFKLFGVRGMVCHGNLPAEIPDSLIAGWLASEVDGAIPGERSIAAVFSLKIGETVKVIDGPLAAFDGRVVRLPKGYNAGQPIEELDESMRVQIAIDLLGRETPVELSVSQVQKS